jgi:hypothetical protein
MWVKNIRVLFSDAVSSSDYIVSYDRMITKMNCKGFGRMQPWLNLWYYPSTCLEELRKTMNPLPSE